MASGLIFVSRFSVLDVTATSPKFSIVSTQTATHPFERIVPSMGAPVLTIIANHVSYLIETPSFDVSKERFRGLQVLRPHELNAKLNSLL
mmetsp:Transcript_7182/g.14765  ORF Transcript_7182/g.14765 Transcript_7182/m.14765 type:complete len:90 (-) Transcript_7182:1149-1418(-)